MHNMLQHHYAGAQLSNCAALRSQASKRFRLDNQNTHDAIVKPNSNKAAQHAAAALTPAATQS
jgi:hypothetical protein